jgi:hypothetical protein
VRGIEAAAAPLLPLPHRPAAPSHRWPRPHRRRAGHGGGRAHGRARGRGIGGDLLNGDLDLDLQIQIYGDLDLHGDLLNGIGGMTVMAGVAVVAGRPCFFYFSIFFAECHFIFFYFSKKNLSSAIFTHGKLFAECPRKNTRQRVLCR